MIDIDQKFLPECSDCVFINPVMNVEKAYAADKMHLVRIRVTCEDYEKCERMRSIFKERYK